MSIRTSTRATGSAALVISMIALLVALGGTSFAAVSLAKNSVGAKQLKPNSVATAKVKDGSLLASDFAAGQLPAGAKGATGATGATGVTGPAGATGAAGVSDYVIVTGPFVTIAAGGTDTSTATCTDGRKPVGGGGGSYNTDVAVTLSAPTDANAQILTALVKNSWTVNLHNSSASNRSFFSYAICARVA